MNDAPHRRPFIQGTPMARHVATIVLLCATSLLRAQQPAESPYTLKQVGPNAWAAIDNSNAKAPAGANAGFVIGDDGVVVIDTFASADAATRLLADIRMRTAAPVKFVVNTHYHADHAAGNAVFANAGATVVAQRNVRGWIHTENLKFLGPNPKPEQKAFIDSLRAPVVGYEQALDLYIGSREVRIRSFPGHTGGDSVVLVPDARVAFGGDLFWRNTAPNMIDASTTPWIATLESLSKSAASYTFVPGHGDVGNAGDLTAFRDYLVTLQKAVADAQSQRLTGDALVKAVMPRLSQQYGQLQFFAVLAPANIAQMDTELSGKKAVPRPQP